MVWEFYETKFLILDDKLNIKIEEDGVLVHERKMKEFRKQKIIHIYQFRGMGVIKRESKRCKIVKVWVPRTEYFSRLA